MSKAKFNTLYLAIKGCDERNFRNLIYILQILKPAHFFIDQISTLCKVLVSLHEMPLLEPFLHFARNSLS